MLGAGVDVALVVALACGAWAAYLAERLAMPPEDALNFERRSEWFQSNRGVSMALMVALSVAMVGAATLLPVGVLLGGVAIGAIGLAYAAPGRWRIKRFGRAKPFLIGTVWSVAVVGLPLVGCGSVSEGALALLLARSLFYAANAMALDWPDRTGDAESGLSTWAVRLGPVAFRRFVLVLACGASAASVGAGFAVDQPMLGLVDAGGALVLVVLIARRLPARRYDGIVLDLLAAWPVVTWIAPHLPG